MELLLARRSKKALAATLISDAMVHYSSRSLERNLPKPWMSCFEKLSRLLSTRVVFLSVISLLAAHSLVFAQVTTVHFSIDVARDVKPISRYIYGVNQFHLFLDGMNGPWSNLAFTRLGGNRFTAYNWTNNASQAGADYHFQNDDYLVAGDAYKRITDIPGGALIPVIDLARAHDAACLLTVPINGYVAADKKTDGDVRKTPDYLETRFKKEEPRKGSPFSLTPHPTAPVVYQDEFVNWVKAKYPYGQDDPRHPIWFSLDNEPDYWHTTHPEIHPKNATYSELINKSIAYADAIKSVEPNALVFGPANYGWHGYISLQGASDANNRDFQEVYLRAMSAAQKARGRRLLDVLDVHWYPEATGGGIRIDQDKPIPALIECAIAGAALALGSDICRDQLDHEEFHSRPGDPAHSPIDG